MQHSERVGACVENYSRFQYAVWGERWFVSTELGSTHKSSRFFKGLGQVHNAVAVSELFVLPY